MNKRAWYLVGMVVLAAACSAPTGPGTAYTPSGTIGSVSLDSLARPKPHGKPNPDQPALP
jgi:hypothetical protein